MLRRCVKCLIEHPATTEFFYQAGTPQCRYLRSDCKACSRVSHAANYQANRAVRDAAAQAWAKAHPEARRQHARTYREANADKCRAAVKAWAAKDPEHARAKGREKAARWFQNNLEHARAIRRNTVKKRRALKRGAGEATLTRAEWQAILARHNHRCAYCDTAGRMTQDHVVPLRDGGSHTAQNIVPACMTCNCSKKAGRPPRPVQPLLLV